MFDDAERKLNIFYDQLNGGEITQQDVLERMAELLRCKQHTFIYPRLRHKLISLFFCNSGLDSRDYQGAQRIQIDLLTTRFDVTGRWMLGVKRLIEFIREAAQAGALQL